MLGDYKIKYFEEPWNMDGWSGGNGAEWRKITLKGDWWFMGNFKVHNIKKIWKGEGLKENKKFMREIECLTK